uniref:Uncharacterized protein MANES_16G046800 n=1 Tax=Rhizophora mucronata TaxID=61149 RepID=A0A2P2KXX5_RHIMU
MKTMGSWAVTLLEVPLNFPQRSRPWRRRRQQQNLPHRVHVRWNMEVGPIAFSNLMRTCSRNADTNSTAAGTTSATPPPPPSSSFCGDKKGVLGLAELRESCKKWLWKGQYSINYFVSSSTTGASLPNPNPPLLLVHGFGASILHWRRNIKTLAQTHDVYAIDLLGFGNSDKPKSFPYTMEAWAQLILDFLNEVVGQPTVLIGNSVGSLACVIAASESNQNLVQGLVLLNCAGGMNNKAIVDDWRIKLLLPLLWLVDFLLKQPIIASSIFERVKQRYCIHLH